MRNILFLLLILTFSLTSCESDTTQASQAREPLVFKDIQINYPLVYQDTLQIDTFFGAAVADPFRWLENAEEPALQRWIETQRRLTNNYLEEIPYRDDIHDRLADIWNFSRYGLPRYVVDRYYLTGNDGLQNQDVLLSSELANGENSLVFDPNSFSPDGTTSIDKFSFSKNGKWLAFQASEGGGDWRRIHVMDAETGETLPDVIEWVKYSNIAWWGDGFFYSRYPLADSIKPLTERNEFHQLFYHKIGEPVENDELVFADRSHPLRNITATTTKNERFLLVKFSENSNGNAYYFRDLEQEDSEMIPIDENFANKYQHIGTDGDRFLVLTNNGAPNGRLVRISTRQPAENFWEDIIAETEDVIHHVSYLHDHLLVTFLRNGVSRLVIYDKNGKELHEVQLPTMGTVTGISEGNLGEVFFAFTSFTWPEVIYRLNLSDYSSSIWKKPQHNFASDAYIVKQEFYQSYDGTRIPLFIIHKKGMNKDGKSPCLLYTYGGFGVPQLPKWNITQLLLFPAFLENGGVCAVAGVRGGGEYGTTWHDAGRLLHKQKAFDDFQAAGDYLVQQNYTSGHKLAAYGRSNGGLVLAASLNQRPDLFQAAVPAVGVYDMMRYQQFTIGWAWADEYGTVDDPDHLSVLRSYSPLHNVIPDRYPATLITTYDYDERVAPAHSYKYAASLQYHQRAKNPVLVWIGEGTGHSGTQSVRRMVDESTDVLSFLFYNLSEDVIYR